MVDKFLGLVVNPKLKKPVFVVWDDSDLMIYRAADEGYPHEGEGEYESSDDPMGTYSRAGVVTGLPRVHTVAGVKSKKLGYGTSLYTGLCLGAHMETEGEVRLNAGVEGDGISSQEGTRSTSAEAWWSRAKQLWLADEYTDYIEEEGVDVTEEVDADELNRCEVLSDDRTITYVGHLNVDTQVAVEADTYTWDSAYDADLVLAAFAYDMVDMSEKALNDVWREMMDDDGSSFYDVNRDALLALDVRGYPKETMHLISVLLRIDGAEEEDIEELMMRWQLGIDPGVPIKQLRLPFKPNAAEAKEIMGLLEQTKERRAQLDWERLSSLP